MMPVRDGIKLETVILDADQRPRARCRSCSAGRRTACRQARSGMPSRIASALAKDGYIFVVQNLRGRFGSEGTFELSSRPTSRIRKRPARRTDAYDSIDWLVEERAQQQRQGRHVRRVATTASPRR